jgi:hypothetical protein
MAYDERLVLEFFENIEERVKKESILERELKVRHVKDKAVSIIGPRRAGKTFYLFHRKREKDGIYFDFESIEFANIEPYDVLKIIELYKSYFETKVNTIFLDEIQNLKNWESLVRSLLNRKYNVYISGSSSKLLSKEIATQLRGRTLTYFLLPFSFREFLRVKKFEMKKIYSEREVSRIKKFLEEYLHWGGFPEIVLKEEKEKILREYFELMFYKDFVERHKAKSLETARTIFEYLIQNFASEISISKIQNFLEKTRGIKTKATIYDYIDKIEDTMVIFLIEKYEPSIYRRKVFPKKVYTCDVALANMLSFSENLGKRMENVVFLEMLRKKNENPLMETYFFKSYHHQEIDFLTREGPRIKQLIQVTYANSFDEIDPREWKALLHGYELFKNHQPELIIITWDYEDKKELSWFGKKAKINFIPLWKWLLFK